MTGMDRCLPMNTGAEAVETALKAVAAGDILSKALRLIRLKLLLAKEIFMANYCYCKYVYRAFV